jgi:hypothetical protein
VCNFVARALVAADNEAAAVLEGMARHFATESQRSQQSPRIPAGSPQTAQPPASARTSVSGLVVDLRRETTGLLVEALGNERLHELRAKGEAMDNDDAVFYALRAISKTGA